ncbi:hypothetical protein, conserved [Plasmodium vivax]|uniref:Uncharacterized protein n=1 Tax=Plasmodium vivax (strain Salvador I) TaxID=126793 RepID=A5K1J7_PLAVS|nr:hypothetical protein, conserved [Plasmodium vivax]EDL47194.1 hypothetical protein, conserved [Plasmodium vivax]|eukprot:XP_001616921.1 hypothetical protein [Plasmodium vivax Sal-1]
MESVKRNENQNEHTQREEKNKLTAFEHNDVVFFKHKEKNKIGIGRVVNFYTELKINDILLVSDHNVTLANYTKILNNINDGKYLQSYIANLGSENGASTPYQASNSNASEKSNCKLYEKEQKQDYKHTNVKEKNEEKEMHANTKTGNNNNSANNPEFKCEMKKRRRRKKTHTKDTALIHSNSISNCVMRKNDEKRKASKLFYIVQSLENYKYILQYKKAFKHYKLFTHKKWEVIKTLFCKNIQNQVSFVLAVKLLEVKKLYANNVNLQNVMINNLMKIYKSEKDLHVDHLVLNFIKKLDVRIILQNNVLITNDDFNEILSRNKKEKEEDSKRKMLHSNKVDGHLDEANATTQGEISHLLGSHRGSCGSGKVGSDYDNGISTSHQGGHVDGQQNDMPHASNVDHFGKCPVDWGMEQPADLGTKQPIDIGTKGLFDFGTKQPFDFGTKQPFDFGTKQPFDFGTKQPLNFGKKQPPKYAAKYLIDYGTKQPTDSPLESDELEGSRKRRKKTKISLQKYARKRKVIEGETYQYELKGNLLAKFKSPQGVAYRGCIKSICKGKNSILSYFLIVPSFFWFNDSFYFSCLNIDMDIFQLLEIIKIVDNSKKKQIESISFAKYKSLRKIYDYMYNPNPNAVHSLLRKGAATENAPVKVRVRAPKGDITKKRKTRKKRTLQVKLGKRKRKERVADKPLKASVTKERTRRRVRKRKKGQEESLDGKVGRGLKIKKRKKEVVQPEVTEKKRRGRKKKVVPIQEERNGEEAKEVKGGRKVEEVKMKKEMEEEVPHEKEEEMHHEKEEEMHRKKEEAPRENETKAQNNEAETNPLSKAPNELGGDDPTKVTQDSFTKRSLFNLNKERTNTYLTKFAHFFKLSENSKQKLKPDDEEGKKGTPPQTVGSETAQENNHMKDDKKETTVITNTNENEQSINVVAKANEEEGVILRKEDPGEKAPNEKANQGCANVNEVTGEAYDQVVDPDNTLISKLIANGKEADEHSVLDPPSVGEGSANEIHKHVSCQQENVDENGVTINDHTEQLNDNGGNTPSAFVEEAVVKDNPKQLEGQVEPLYQKMAQMDIKNEEEIFKKENFGDLNEDNDEKPTNYKNGILGDKRDSLTGDSRSDQNESTTSQNSYEKKETANGYNGSDQNESTTSQNSYEKKEALNGENACDRNEFTDSPKYDEKMEQAIGAGASEVNQSMSGTLMSYANQPMSGTLMSYANQPMSGTLMSFPNEPMSGTLMSFPNEPMSGTLMNFPNGQMSGAIMSFPNDPINRTIISDANDPVNGTIIGEANHVDNRSNAHLRKVSNTNKLVKKEPEENDHYNLTVHIDLSNKNDTPRVYSTTQAYCNNYCKNKLAEHIKKFLDDEKIKKIETLYKFCKEDINILLYVYVMHIYVSKLCKNVIVKVLNPKCKNVKKKKYPDNDFILTPLIGYSYANYYYLKINKRKRKTKMKGKTKMKTKMEKKAEKKTEKKTKAKIKTEKKTKAKTKTEKKIDQRFKLIKKTLITKKRKRKKKKKRGRKKKLIEQTKTEVKRRRRRRRRTRKKKSDLLSDTYVKPKRSRSRLKKISKMKNTDDKTCGKTENVIKCTTKFVNFYLWGIYNWNYNKTLRVSFNNISNKKISSFDIYNFFFYNYDTISNLNEINKDLSTLIGIYKNVRTVLYQNSSIYGNLFLLKPTNSMTRTHSDDELIKFWLKTLNELHQIREGFCKFF